MENLSSRQALGGTVELGVIDGDPRFGLKVRQRRWLARGRVFDLSAGGVRETIRDPDWLEGGCGTCNEPKYGFTADATYGGRGVGVTVGADAVPGYGHVNTTLRAGGRVSGTHGLAASGLMLLGVAVLWVAASFMLPLQ